MFSLKKVDPFPDRKMTKLLTGFRHYDIHGYQGFPAKMTLVHLKKYTYLRVKPHCMLLS